jgi:dolichol-phosphate mannosyltransferase
MTTKPTGEEKPLLSIIVPCFNEEEVLPETFRRLNAFRSELEGWGLEIIFVDDGSRDRTSELLRQRAIDDPWVRFIRFARNFGHQMAVSAGIDAARGEAVVLIDADLQDPPEVIHEMLAKWREGYQVIYGIRAERLGETRFKKASARFFYRMLNMMSDLPIPLDTGDFRLMDRRVVDVLKSMPERDRFVRGLVSWVGFRQYALAYKRAERFAGVSKYPLRKMIRFAADGILSFSSKPLHMATGLGVAAACLAVCGIVFVLYLKLFTGDVLPGWSAIMIAMLFLGGVQLICLGIVGEYIGRIYGEAKKRPLYIVAEDSGNMNRQDV